jgi:ATP-dependent protease ClpP protease subunit
MSAYLKGLCILASIIVLGFGFMSVHHASAGSACDTLTLTGDITPEIFLSAKACLVQSSAKKKTFVVTNSGGGSWESALALGILIHRHGWDVEVVDICASSCANFIFPAGKVKYLHSNALLLFHGGPHQHNILAQAIEADQAAVANAEPVVAKDPGHARMEGHASVDDKGPQRLQVLEFLSITNVTSAVDLVTRLRNVSDQFYDELGINKLLPTYGQIGKYEPIYNSYKHGGFIYRLDSLRRLGIGNIEVKGGEWHPERHRDYPDVYEVTYP